MTSAADKPRKYWGVVPALPGALLAMIAKEAEAQGRQGVFAVQVHGAPFPTLAVAAAATETLEVASGIAIACTRSPLETAMTAMDMDRISDGRFILGLGASAVPWTEGFHGVPRRKPLTDLRETVRAIRYIVANAHKKLEPFEGEYYKADFAEFQPTEAPVREDIPIWTAALGKPAVRLAGEISDGIIGHPMWTIEWAKEMVEGELGKGLAKAGRARDDVHVNLWVWAAPHENPQQGIDDARLTVAFYAGISQYQSYFAGRGFGEQARALQEPIAQGDLAAAARLVPDEMVRAFVACGTESEINDYLDRAWEVADSICVVPPPWGLEMDTTIEYHTRLAALVS